MVIEIIAKAADNLPEGAGLCVGNGTPYLIPPETLVDIPAAQHTADENNQNQHYRQTPVNRNTYFHLQNE